jgi:LysM repeat protein
LLSYTHNGFIFVSFLLMHASISPMKLHSILVILLFLLVQNAFANYHPTDSVGVEKKDGKVFILHKVDPKETFYSVARKYKCSVSALQAANSGVTELKVGEVIKVPSTTAKAAATSTAPKANSKAKSNNPESHKVKSGETLFSIARLYGVSANELKVWNGLGTGSLSEGQVLKLKAPAKGVASVQIEKGGEQVIKPETNAAPAKEGEAKIDLGESGFERVVEKGIAEVIDDQKNSKLHLALHKTAPVGTILKVKNEVNGFSVYVRVIGKLPDTGDNSKVIVKISRKAFNTLEAGSKEFPVEVSFSKP